MNHVLRIAAAACLFSLCACKNGSEQKGHDKASGAKTGAAQPAPEGKKSGAEPNKAPPPPKRETKPLPPDPGGANEGNHMWSLRYGGTESDAGRALARAPNGDLAAAGYVKGKTSFGAGVVHESEGSDAYVARFSSEGKLGWVLAFGGPGDDVAESVAVDADGNAIVVGSFAESLVVGKSSMPSEGADDMFIIKLDPKGHVLWGKRFGGDDVDAAQQVTTDGDGNVLVTGVFRKKVSFGKTRLESKGGPDIFLLKLSPDGDILWAKSWGEMGKDYGRAIAVDSHGDLVLLAEFTLGVDFGGGKLDNAGNRDIALVKLTADGDHVWSESFGNELDSLGIDVAIDPADNILVTGGFDDVHSFGGREFRARGRSDAFIAKYDPNGHHLWSHAYGAKDEDLGAAVTTDRYGNIYATGWFWQEADFGKGQLKSAGKRDAYLLKLSPAGDTLWEKRFGAKQSDFGRDLVAMDDGGVVLLGTFYFTVSFGGEKLTALEAKKALIPKSDVFLARFSR